MLQCWNSISCQRLPHLHSATCSHRTNTTNSWVQFNDVFGFFVNGSNIALLPGVTPPTPVSINTVNLTANTQFFINNDMQSPAVAPVDTEMDGLTVVLTATAQVNANQTNHMKLAIGDADDFAVDSNVFIEAGSLSSSTLTFNPTSVDFGNQPVNTTSGKQPITVTNTGTAAVNITSVVASAGFGETDNCVGAPACERNVHNSGDVHTDDRDGVHRNNRGERRCGR